MEKGLFIGKLREGKRVTTEGKVILPDKSELVLEGVTTEAKTGMDLKEGYEEGYIIFHREGVEPMLQRVTKTKVTEEICRINLETVCLVEIKGE